MKKAITSLLALTALTLVMPLASSAAPAADINYGDDSSDFSNDGECDDPRFVGPATTDSPDWSSTGADATDCRQSVKAGARYWFNTTEFHTPICSAEDFGDDSGMFSNDGACDDPRYFGFASGTILLVSDTKVDASDCRRACEFGLLFSRPTE